MAVTCMTLMLSPGRQGLAADAVTPVQVLLDLRFDDVKRPFADSGPLDLQGLSGHDVRLVERDGGRAAELNGETSYVSIPSHPELAKLTKGAFTIEFDVKPGAVTVGDTGLVGTSRPGLQIFVNPSGYVYAYLITETQPWHISAPPWPGLTDGQWRHVRLSYDGVGKILWGLDDKIFVDAASTNSALKVTDDDFALIVGRYGYDKRFFNGVVDNVVVRTGFDSAAESVDSDAAGGSPLFHALFDGDAHAGTAAGDPKPLYHGRLDYVEGIEGQAVSLTGEGIAYATAENVKRDQGTIMFWFKGLDPNDVLCRRQAKRKFFFEIGNWNETMRLYWPGNGQRMLFYEFLCMGQPEAKTHRVCCGFFRPEDRWVSAGKWRHLAATWRTGKEAKLFFDGDLVLTKKQINLPAEMSNDIVFGRGTPVLIMDELKIFGKALPARLIKHEYAKVAERMKDRLVVMGSATAGSEEGQNPELALEPWFDNGLGEDDVTPPPWTPLEVNGDQASCWGASVTFRDLLPSEILLRDRTKLLSGPVRLRLTDDGGKEIRLHFGGTTLRAAKRTECLLRTEASAPALDASANLKMEFDGFVRVKLALKPKRDLRIRRMWIEIPVKRDHAKYYNICGTWKSYLGIPSGRIPEAGMDKGFEPYVWIGDEDRGLCWCAESKWNWNITEPERTIQLRYGDDALSLKINICDGLTEFPAGNEIEYEFGLMATPSRPFIPGRRLWRTGGADLRGVSGRNMLMNGIPWYWSKPWMTFYELSDEELARWRKRREETAPKFVRYFLPVYANFGNWGYQAEGQPVRPYYGKYRPTWAVFPYHENNWPIPKEHGGWSKTFSFCPNSTSFRDFYVWSFSRYLDRARTNGLYIDQTFTKYCSNPRHGCVAQTPGGGAIGKYPIFAHRELMKRICKLARKRNPEFLFFTHDSQFLIPPQRSFSDISTGGEAVPPYLTDDPLDNLSLDRIKAEFLGRQFGIVSWFLPEITRPYNKLDAEQTLTCSQRLVNLLFLHDIQIWRMFIHAKPVEDLWEALNRYELDDGAVFTPYWELDAGKASGPKPPRDDLKVSLYKIRNGSLIFAVYNTGQAPFSGTIPVDWQALGRPHAPEARAELLCGRGDVRSLSGNGLEIAVGPRDGMTIGIPAAAR